MAPVSNTTATTTTSTSTTTGTATPAGDSTTLSPLGQFASWLHGLSTSNPSQYQKVTSDISNGLQKAATVAQHNGNTTLASELDDLSSQFQTASQNGQFPAASQLQQAAQALASVEGASATNNIASLMLG
jgi:hypothetical protein